MKDALDELDKLNCKFDELAKLKDEFDQLDKLKDEFDELDKLNCEFDELDKLNCNIQHEVVWLLYMEKICCSFKYFSSVYVCI